MEVLITGASGFIGSAIADELCRRGHAVSGLVRRRPEKTDTWQPLHADLKAIDSLAGALQKKDFDVVIDAAANIPKSRGDDDFFDNIAMSHNILKAFEKTPPRFFLKLSTVDVYKIDGIITEKNEIEPRNCYSLSKRVGEQFVELWGKQCDVPTCILRLSQVFGQRDRTSKFIPSVIKNIKENAVAVVHGDGLDRRDHLFIDDLKVMAAEFCEKKISGIFNVASGKSHSLNQIVDILREIVDADFKVEYRNRTKPRVDYVFDIRKLEKALGAIKATPMREALRKVYYETT